MVGRHAALVTPVHVDLPPIDLGRAVGGEALVAAPRRVAPGEREGEGLARPGVERLDDPLGELAGHVVHDNELTVHRRKSRADASACS